MRLILLILMIALLPSCKSAPPSAPAPKAKPAMADAYLDLITTYVTYSPQIWHDDPAGAGGYWGDGVGAWEKNGNGAVRAMCNTMLGYAVVVHAMDQGWLSEEQTGRLLSAGFTREKLVWYVRENLKHVVAHHVSNPNVFKPKWGLSWQSALWLGSAGCAAMLVWDDLPNDLRAGIARVAASEADRIAAKPPADYKPGNTGAEENAWDAHAPAIAIALHGNGTEPADPNVQRWWRALTSYAVNTYSTQADQTSDAMIGADRSRDIVTTSNLFNDYSLENHGFFHPDYVQASGEELGEAWLFLAQGDGLRHTSFADDFAPYAMHHVADVWTRVAKPITLSDGQFAFPCGQDWTLNTGMTPTYFAFIGTVLGDPVAVEAERQNIKHAMKRQSVSPPGRIFGDSAMEWWWEPLLVKRCASALLQHERLPQHAASVPTGVNELYLPDVKVWSDRNTEYCVTASWGSRRMGTFIPDPLRTAYLTYPVTNAILPDDVSEWIDDRQIGDAHILRLKTKAGACCTVVCLPHSVVWISPTNLRGMGIENDRMSGGARELTFAGGKERVIALQPREAFRIRGSWLNIDDKLGLIAAGEGFQYTPSGKYNTRSTAVDRVEPINATVWQMIAHAGEYQTRSCAAGFTAKTESQIIAVSAVDGDGRRYQIRAALAPGGEVQVQQE